MVSSLRLRFWNMLLTSFSQIAFGVLEVIRTYLVWNKVLKPQKEKRYEYIVYIET